MEKIRVNYAVKTVILYPNLQHHTNTPLISTVLATHHQLTQVAYIHPAKCLWEIKPKAKMWPCFHLYRALSSALIGQRRSTIKAENTLRGVLFKSSTSLYLLPNTFLSAFPWWIARLLLLMSAYLSNVSTSKASYPLFREHLSTVWTLIGSNTLTMFLFSANAWLHASHTF